MLNCKTSKTAISFQFFCNFPSVTCSHMPFECIHYSVTLFIFEYAHKIVPDPPLVISPPLCTETLITKKSSLGPLGIWSLRVLLAGSSCCSGEW